RAVARPAQDTGARKVARSAPIPDAAHVAMHADRAAALAHEHGAQSRARPRGVAVSDTWLPRGGCAGVRAGRVRVRARSGRARARDADIPRGRPIILADTQDNPGAGGNADTTSLLKALLAARVAGVLAGVIWDAACAERAHAAGQGATLELSLGAHA